MGVASIRVVPALLQRGAGGAIIPSIRFVDPEAEDRTEAEFFSVAVEHLDSLIAGIQRAAADATARAEQMRNATPEELALLKAPSAGGMV
ncbi:MAG: hypothetical protein JHC96_05680 [Brevundimonas sp.]|uniref:hypothetical protein n=1 Tax=Brevundimonas sp. TaxID=1871086 RepID=UPI001A204356|nr:hypothetical protein [Brevundimonas sp.]MBJ7318269.1 hypothetical protein [Brevundimonas sp.]